jgi:hypothetical protein
MRYAQAFRKIENALFRAGTGRETGDVSPPQMKLPFTGVVLVVSLAAVLSVVNL